MDAPLPGFVTDELRGLLDSGVLIKGCAHFRCGGCGLDRLVAPSWKGPGFWPRCAGRRMTETARPPPTRSRSPTTSPPSRTRTARRRAAAAPSSTCPITTSSTGRCSCPPASKRDSTASTSTPRRAVSAHDRERHEGLLRDFLRPPLPHDRLCYLRSPRGGMVILQLDKPWQDPTTHVELTPSAFLTRLASLVPRPRNNTSHDFGVLAANASGRKQLVRNTERRVARNEDASLAALMKHFGARRPRLPTRRLQRPPHPRRGDLRPRRSEAPPRAPPPLHRAHPGPERERPTRALDRGLRLRVSGADDARRDAPLRPLPRKARPEHAPRAPKTAEHPHETARTPPPRPSGIAGTEPMDRERRRGVASPGGE